MIARVAFLVIVVHVPFAIRVVLVLVDVSGLVAIFALRFHVARVVLVVMVGVLLSLLLSLCVYVVALSIWLYCCCVLLGLLFLLYLLFSLFSLFCCCD